MMRRSLTIAEFSGRIMRSLSVSRLLFFACMLIAVHAAYSQAVRAEIKPRTIEFGFSGFIVPYHQLFKKVVIENEEEQIQKRPLSPLTGGSGLYLGYNVGLPGNIRQLPYLTLGLEIFLAFPKEERTIQLSHETIPVGIYFLSSLSLKLPIRLHSIVALYPVVGFGLSNYTERQLEGDNYTGIDFTPGGGIEFFGKRFAVVFLELRYLISMGWTRSSIQVEGVDYPVRKTVQYGALALNLGFGFQLPPLRAFPADEAKAEPAKPRTAREKKFGLGIHGAFMPAVFAQHEERESVIKAKTTGGVGVFFEYLVARCFSLGLELSMFFPEMYLHPNDEPWGPQPGMFIRVPLRASFPITLSRRIVLYPLVAVGYTDLVAMAIHEEAMHYHGILVGAGLGLNAAVLKWLGLFFEARYLLHVGFGSRWYWDSVRVMVHSPELLAGLRFTWTSL
jgi:hypothetical protein